MYQDVDALPALIDPETLLDGPGQRTYLPAMMALLWRDVRRDPRHGEAEADFTTILTTPGTRRDGRTAHPDAIDLAAVILLHVSGDGLVAATLAPDFAASMLVPPPGERIVRLDADTVAGWLDDSARGILSAVTDLSALLRRPSMLQVLRR